MMAYWNVGKMRLKEEIQFINDLFYFDFGFATVIACLIFAVMIPKRI